MGVPARRIEAEPFARRSAHLRLVTTPPAPAPKKARTATRSARTRTTATTAPRTSAKTQTAPRTAPRASTRARDRAAEARAKVIFTTFVAVFAFAIVLGGARVTFLVHASEATILEGRVQAAIKAQRAEVDRLEVDRNTLSTPSRIAGIAKSTMDMDEPASVRYLSLPGSEVDAGGAATSGSTAAPVTQSSSGADMLGLLFGALTETSAGDAQSLLVGDLGLAGSR